MKITAKAIKMAKLNGVDIIAEFKKPDVKVIPFSELEKEPFKNIFFKIAKVSIEYLEYYTYTDINKQKTLILP